MRLYFFQLRTPPPPPPPPTKTVLKKKCWRGAGWGRGVSVWGWG